MSFEELGHFFAAGPGLPIGRTVAMAIMLAGAALLAFGRESRRSIMALWVAQAGSGAILLASGAEMIALSQWISCTLVCAIYFLHADLFESSLEGATPGAGWSWARAVFPAVVSGCFGFAVWALLGEAQSWVSRAVPQGPQPEPGSDERLVLLELLALFSLSAAVASGVISRARRKTP